MHADPEELASGLDEVAVFCAASPSGQSFAADLMRRLVDEAEALADKHETERARRLRILAVRCETVAGTDLKDEDRQPIRAIAPGLFPPRSMDEARQLAALGEDAVAWLGPVRRRPRRRGSRQRTLPSSDRRCKGGYHDRRLHGIRGDSRAGGVVPHP